MYYFHLMIGVKVLLLMKKPSLYRNVNEICQILKLPRIPPVKTQYDCSKLLSTGKQPIDLYIFTHKMSFAAK